MRQLVGHAVAEFRTDREPFGEGRYTVRCECGSEWAGANGPGHVGTVRVFHRADVLHGCGDHSECVGSGCVVAYRAGVFQRPTALASH